MEFKFSSYEQYLEAYKYLLRVLEPFRYNRRRLIIEIVAPYDDEVVKRLNSINET